MECSVFGVPRLYVKGRRSEGYLVCNSVAQAVVDQVRGQHDEFVFVWRRERVKNFDKEPAMQYEPIEAMNTTPPGRQPAAERAWPTCTSTTCGTRWVWGCGKPVSERTRGRTCEARDDGALLGGADSVRSGPRWSSSRTKPVARTGL
jgi:hypothetical protein